MCINGNAVFEAKYAAKGKPRKTFQNVPDRLKFAEESIVELRKNCPESLLSGLVRVDIMQNDEGQMVVNEFESLEADHEFSGISAKQFYNNFAVKLEKYYVDMLCLFANEVLCERK